MKKLSFLIGIIVLIGSLQAQQIAPTYWYFGTNASIKFWPDGSTSTSGNCLMDTWEGCTIVNDVGGDVVFYANGVQMWDKQGLLDVTLLGDNSATQASLIVPIPSEENPAVYKFLVFSVRAVIDQNPPPNFSVCFVKVTPTGGQPAYIVEPDEPGYVTESGRMAEKLTSTADGSGGFWVVTHNFSGVPANTFYLYHITEAFSDIESTAEAITLLPTVEKTQSTGASHDGSTILENGQGQMKFNLDGDTLGLTIAGSSMFEIFTFNKSTGDLSDPPIFTHQVDNSKGHLYGCEFSPDSKHFFTSEGRANTDPGPGEDRHIYQWYIAGPNLLGPVIIATDNPYPVDNYAFNALQIGPDGKIYGTHRSNTPKLSVINEPNVFGGGCQYQQDAVPIVGTARFGLPSYAVLGSSSSPPPPWACQCTDATIAGPITGIDPVQGTAEIQLTLNSGHIVASGVSIELVNFDVVPQNEDCQNYRRLKTTQMGMITEPVPMLLLQRGLLTPLQPGSIASTSHEVMWDLRSAPQQITDSEVVLKLAFPTMYNLDCCPVEEMIYYATFRVNYIDADCHSCQQWLFCQSH